MQKSEKEKLVQKLRRAADAQRRAYPGNIYHDGEAQGLDMAAGIIGKIRCEEEQRWIPCSERMPKQGQEVICQCRASIVNVLKLDANGDWYQDANHCYMGGFVIAWMPLPEPYEERREADGSD